MQKSIYLECVTARSKKFYELELHDSKVIVNFGRINRTGKEINKDFISVDQALKFYEKQLNTKLKKYSIKNKRFKQLKFNF